MSFFSVALERSWYQPNWLTPLLWPFSVVYAVGWMIYKALHPLRRGETVASVPVIVVGNLTVGGTGKTPLVVWLAQALNDAGYRPGIISRGYGGRARQPMEVTAVMDPTVAGDEAVMMAGMTDVPVLVDYDRCRGIEFLYRQCNVNFFRFDIYQATGLATAAARLNSESHPKVHPPLPNKKAIYLYDTQGNSYF